MSPHVRLSALLLLSLGVAGVRGLPLAAQSLDAASEDRWAGTYELSGVNRDGSTYGGTLNIEQDEPHRLYLEWRDDDSSYQGLGARVGQSLYAVWGSAEAQCIVMFLEVQADGALDGFWFRAKDRTLARGTERAVPTGDRRAGEIFAVYAVAGEAPDGSKYAREVKVKHLEGDFYRFRWGGEEVLEGIGKMVEDRVEIIASVSGHEGQCGKTEITRDEHGVLHGTWTMNDDKFDVVGTELAVPVGRD